jgi:hypothetical protein
VPYFCPARHPAQHAHDLAHARYATPSQSGWWVYVQCGDCGMCYREAISVWETELRRRAAEAAEGGPTVTHDGWYRSTI